MDTGTTPNLPMPGYSAPIQIPPPYNISYNVQQPPYTAMTHNQERLMLQQQIQEIYLLPPAPENQDKIHRAQERINVLQQHESTDQCPGGTPSSCVLQNPMFSMIDSPQVTSTTGRGRGRGSNSKPRKPRQKKSEKQSQAQATEDGTNLVDPSNLPVSEDSVTAGTGLSDLSQMYSEENDMADISQDNSVGDLDTSTDASGKKIKKPRKPRAPKIPKEPKSPKEQKERKKKEKDSEKSRKKRNKKAASDADVGENSISHDNNSTEFSKHTSEGEENQTLASLMHNQNSTDANSGETQETSETAKTDGDETKADGDEVTDFDDIPVSKIAIKSLLEEKCDAKSTISDEGNAGSEDPYSMNEDESPAKKKKSKSRRSTGMNKNRGRGSRGGKTNRRSGRVKIVQDSGDEADDMIATPPASPTGEDAEIDSSKRRSARNTQRKKYTDDVLLRFSDDEAPGLISPVKRESSKSDDLKKDKVDGEDSLNVSTSEQQEGHTEEGEIKIPPPPEDISNKPNYVYINTTDEDTMIVQFVLAQRMGKRELKPEPPAEIKKDESEIKTETDEIKPDVSEVKQEGDAVETEKKCDDEESAEVPLPEESKMEVDSEKPIEEAEKPEKPDTPMKSPEATPEPEPEPEKMETDVEKPADVEMEVPPVVNEVEAPEIAKTESDDKTESDETKPEDKNEASKTDEAKSDKSEPVLVEVEEFLVKYRNFSYLHCEWRTEDELLKGDKRVSNKIRRFQQKQAHQFNIFENLEEDPFNPDFVEVDRVLDVSEHTDDDGNKVKHFLVKWKSLPYEDSTWELEEDIEEINIEQFERFNKVPPKNEWKLKRRPHPDQWKQLDKTPIFKGGNSLRPYQLEGLNWLKYSWYKGNNCILADEMGKSKKL